MDERLQFVARRLVALSWESCPRIFLIICCPTLRHTGPAIPLAATLATIEVDISLANSCNEWL